MSGATDNLAPEPVARPARSRLFSIACALSMIAFLSFAAGWTRSYWIRDVERLPAPGGRTHVVTSTQGRIDLESPSRRVRVPYWLPTTFSAILPFAWLVCRRPRG